MSPRLRVLEVSAARGDGLGAWHGWLPERLDEVQQGQALPVRR